MQFGFNQAKGLQANPDLQVGNQLGKDFPNGLKKRQATKIVARLDNQRRSNVSEWSNYNTYR